MMSPTLRVLAHDWRALATAGLFAIVFRLLVFIPLPVPVPEVAAPVRDDAYLTLFDVFIGGAASHFGLLTLGLMPFLLARILVRAFQPTLASDEFRWEGRLWPRWTVAAWTAVVALIMAVVYVASLRQLGADFGEEIPTVATLIGWLTLGAFIPVLACGLLRRMFARLHPPPVAGRRSALMLTRDLRTTSGTIGFMLGVNILAALPEHVVVPTQPEETAYRFVVLSLCATVMLLAAQIRRNIPINVLKRDTRSGRFGGPSTLPFAPCSFGYLPWIFALVVVLGIVAMSSLLLVGSAVPWVRTLAAIEREVTDPRSWGFWTMFIVWGIVIQVWFWLGRARSITEQMRKSGRFFEFIRPGRQTLLYLEAIFLRGVVIAAPLNMLLLSTPAFVALARDDVGTWPVMLLPLVFCGEKVRGAADALRASVYELEYEGLIRKAGRRR